MAAMFFALSTLKSKFEDRERGATAVEYGLLVALIAAIIVGTVVILGQDVLKGFQTVEGALP
ncbi:Flp family type IVb pilin [Ornithinimicrobium cerasi]|uniref:Pilus assembly protein Flp/PilA n=1 Tax=Ornithinimicrobium cerasi TaxID=2248773 RepID=A0A285VD61_9MICO|nr:Flp family type IVb pilin [Ornithinimicrobium cerasi]SOC51923.1 pilus assembly protein Flp/PilA [Ornithinimicrobium cerasi]